MTLPQRLITEPRTTERGLNELTEPAILHAISSTLAITPGTPFEELERTGVTMTGAQLKALCKRLADESRQHTAHERTEALGDADERWRERLDLAVEAMRMYRGDRGASPLARIADALAIAPGKTNLRARLESNLGVKPELAEQAVTAAIEQILTQLANPRAHASGGSTIHVVQAPEVPR